MKTHRPNTLNNWAASKSGPTSRPAPRSDLETERIVDRILGKSTTHPYTTAPAAIGSISGTPPEFGRWQDVQRLFSIKRGTLYNLLAEGVVKSVSIRRKGNVHGCRLFYLPGIRDYLNSLMAQQEGGDRE